jgi:protein-S-isoprenylcysteine O-methyltransferase Ste14
MNLRRYERLILDRQLPAWWRGLGIALLGTGLTLAIWCVATFIVRGRGTPAPFDAPRHLVATGPYHCMRNPMYIGGGLVLLGFGFEEASPAIVSFVPV